MVWMILLRVFGIVLILKVVSSRSADGIIAGSIKVNGETLYLAESNGAWGGISVSGNSITVSHGPRFYLASQSSPNFSPYIFKTFPLLGGWLSYQVDLSKVGCGCNAAVYLVSMPAYNKSSQPDPTKCGDYYCDANAVCGELCPEMDLLEANNHAFSITPHSCGNSEVGKHWYWCDGGGCSRNSYHLNPKLYGPGDEFIINSNHPFRMNFSFIQGSDGKLEEISTIVTGYNGKTYKITHTDPTCPQPTKIMDLTDSIKNGMVLTISSWGTDGKTMKWLDVPPCSLSTSCNKGPFIISDIQYKEGV